MSTIWKAIRALLARLIRAVGERPSATDDRDAREDDVLDAWLDEDEIGATGL